MNQSLAGAEEKITMNQSLAGAINNNKRQAIRCTWRYSNTYAYFGSNY